jgi:hypothetical protein
VALVIDIAVNTNRLFRVTAQRQWPDGRTTDPDTMGRYEVRLDGDVTAWLDHRYGDGAITLAEKAIMAVRTVAAFRERELLGDTPVVPDAPTA